MDETAILEEVKSSGSISGMVAGEVLKDMLGDTVELLASAEVVGGAESVKAGKIETKPARKESRDVIALQRAKDMLGGELFGKIELDMAGMAKKPREKVMNVISFITDRGKLSTYTNIAYSQLVTAGKISAKDLTELYIASGYKEGTARSQAQQMMDALPVLRIAVKEGKELEYHPGSGADDKIVAALMRMGSTEKIEPPAPPAPTVEVPEDHEELLLTALDPDEPAGVEEPEDEDDWGDDEDFEDDEEDDGAADFD